MTFCVSVLTSGQNQELVSYSWIFPNVVTSGHWWYSNIPAYIEQDCRARLQAVPKTKQIGYYSDAYKLEFVLPKYNMYRRVLAGILAEDFVKPGELQKHRRSSLPRSCCATTRGGSLAFEQMDPHPQPLSPKRGEGMESAHDTNGNKS